VSAFVAIVLILFGLVFAATGTLQVATGRYVGIRRLSSTPSIEKIRLRGWIGMGAGFLALLFAATLLTAGALRTGLQASTWIVSLGFCAVLSLRLQSLQRPITDSDPPAVTRRWTVIGACVAVAALAFLIAAVANIAVAGTPCSWPPSVTTLSGLGLIASVLPALVAIRQTMRRERRPIAYWLMVVTDVAAFGVYLWLLSTHNQGCSGGFVSSILP
jgi:hypothetical protein